MLKRNFVTIADLSREKILYMIELASEFEKHPNREILKGKVVATLFYEPSTRTRLSFETAANRLGARVIGFSDAKASSVSKGDKRILPCLSPQEQRGEQRPSGLLNQELRSWNKVYRGKNVQTRVCS